jgi:hypothetical protein
MGRRANLELDVEDAAEQLGGQVVEAHLVLGDLVHGRLHLRRARSSSKQEQENQLPGQETAGGIERGGGAYT